jgi:hypothetical protein
VEFWDTASGRLANLGLADVLDGSAAPAEGEPDAGARLDKLVRRCLREVDLEARAVTAQRLESGRWVTLGVYGDETEARIEPFDVVPIDVSSWWPPESPPR